MHFDKGTVPQYYTRYIFKKNLLNILLLGGLCLAVIGSTCLGAVNIGILDVISSLAGKNVSGRFDLIIWHIRLPQTLTAVAAGAGLAGAGTVMQSVLKNPLASPFTLGISHAAAFGAALAVMVLGAGTMGSSLGDAVSISSPMLTLGSAFGFSMTAAGLVTIMAKLRRASPEAMVLTGVALGSLFTAGTMLLQFFADDVQLAAMVFWTFGDVARTGWKDLAVMTGITALILAYFWWNAWNYNAMDMGDETAKGLGVRVERIRLCSMMAASFVTSVIISFVGIIGFIGLVAPHMVRRLIGDDHRYLMPGSVLAGALILTAADLGARLILLPHVLPVSVFTSFFGAPVFIYLIIKRK